MAAGTVGAPSFERLPEGRFKFVRHIPALGDVILLAEDLRVGAGGLSATVFVMHDDGTHQGKSRPLAYSEIHLMKDEEQVRLGNRAIKRATAALRSAYTSERIQDDLMLFCLEVRDSRDTLFPVEEMTGVDSPINFILEPYLMEGAGTILFAPPGRGKSFITMLMAASVNAGVSKYWKVNPAAKGKVLFVNMERSSPSVQRRLWAVNQALGLPAQTPMPFINARGRTLQQLASSIRAAKQARDIQVIFFDSLSRGGAGKLTDDNVGNAIMDTLNGFDCAWLAIGHTPRQDEGHVFGSQMFDAACDVAVQMLSEVHGSTTGIGLKVTKANDIPTNDMEIIALEFNQAGLAGVRRPGRGEFSQLEAGKDLSLPDLIEQYLLGCYGARATPGEISTAIGRPRTKVSEALQDPKRFRVVLTQGNQKFYGVAASIGGKP